MLMNWPRQGVLRRCPEKFNDYTLQLCMLIQGNCSISTHTGGRRSFTLTGHFVAAIAVSRKSGRQPTKNGTTKKRKLTQMREPFGAMIVRGAKGQTREGTPW